jgi:hypothetical protein
VISASARGVAGLLAGLRLARELALLQLGGEGACGRERAAGCGRGRELVIRREGACPVLGRDLGFDQVLAGRVVCRECPRRAGRGLVGGADLGAGRRRQRSASIAEDLLLGDPGAREVGCGRGQRRGLLELVLVALARVVEARDAERGDCGKRKRQRDERQAQRAGDRKTLHTMDVGGCGKPG